MKRLYFRVLSMWQPWATLAVAPDPTRDGKPAKEYETRAFHPERYTRPSKLPIPVVIHATKSWGPAQYDAVADVGFPNALMRSGFHHLPDRAQNRLSKQSERRLATLKAGQLQYLPLGQIIGVAVIESATRTEIILGKLREEEYRFGNYAPDRWAWKFADACMLREPIPFKGQQQPLYQLDEQTLERVWTQL